MHLNAGPDVKFHALQALHAGHGRELLEQRVRCLGGHSQALDLAVQQGGRNGAGHGQESHVDLPAHQVRQQGGNAFVGHMEHLHLGQLRELLANQVVERARPYAAIAQGLVAVLAGQSQQFINRLDVERIAHGEDGVGGGKLRHHLEIF